MNHEEENELLRMFDDMIAGYDGPSNKDASVDKNCYLHNWKKYEGLWEVFHYCENCDMKNYDLWKALK